MKENMDNAVKEIGVVIIFVAVLALIVGSILGNSVFSDIGSTGSATNETLSAVDATTNSTFAIISSHSDATCALTEVHNASGGEVILVTGNYTFYTDCNIILIALSPYIGEDLNVSYTSSYASGTNVAGVNITNLSESFGGFVTGLIAFFAIAGVLLGILFLVKYVVKLFSKDDGLGAISA